MCTHTDTHTRMYICAYKIYLLYTSGAELLSPQLSTWSSLRAVGTSEAKPSQTPEPHTHTHTRSKSEREQSLWGPFMVICWSASVYCQECCFLFSRLSLIACTKGNLTVRVGGGHIKSITSVNSPPWHQMSYSEFTLLSAERWRSFEHIDPSVGPLCSWPICQSLQHSG